jgi:thioester reductase-like protein
MSTHLMTGFPGFIGRRLVAELLARDPELKIVALVEARMLAPAEAAAASIDPDGGRIELVTGDISAPRLGLEAETYARLAAEVTVVEHLAAIYDLAVPLEIAQRVNVDGTGNVLDFCEACDSLERLNYVSTAYVAGDRTGVVYEHELALGQGFKNHYESTKFQAEVWVRERFDRVPTTIYRPAIVVGDSKTGETQKFDGPYYVLRFIEASTRRRLPVPNIGRGVVPFNVVPVDFIVDSMVALAQEPAAAGATVHLCDPSPLSAHDMFGVLCRELAGKEPAYTVPAAPVAASLRSKALRKFFGGVPRETIRYMNHPVRYDTRKATELLSAAGLSCPGFASYAPAMVGFFRANSDDPALLGQAG